MSKILFVSNISNKITSAFVGDETNSVTENSVPASIIGRKRCGGYI